MRSFGQWLMMVALIAGLVGFLMSSGIGSSWLGKLPGDIRIERENLRFYFPFTTCLVLSLLVSLLLRWLRW